MYTTEDSISRLVPTGLFINENVDTQTVHTLTSIQAYLTDIDSEGKGIHEILASVDDFQLMQSMSMLGSRYDFKVVQQQGRYLLHIIDVIPAVSTVCITNRQKRDDLLRQTDWIDSSTVLSKQSRLSMQAYRQLLRDIFEVVNVNSAVIFPEPPKLVFDYPFMRNIQYASDLEKQFQDATVPSELQSKWNMFLQQWHNLGKTTNSDAVKALLEIYCPELTGSTLSYLIQ